MVRTRTFHLVIAVLVALGIGAAVAPWPAQLGGDTTGDRALADRVRDITSGEQRVGLAVAVLDRGRLRAAGLGDTGKGTGVRPGTRFEIGSVTKTLTASVFADMVHDGVVAPDDTVRDVLPGRDWQEGGIRDVTLAQLASQRSGLPRLPLTPRTYLAGTAGNLFGMDPYGDADAADVVGAAASSPLPTEGDYAYSNLGFAFLGQVLAAKAGKPYPQLLRDRVLAPLHMDDTVIPSPSSGPPDGRAVGHDGSGGRVDPWISPGYAPAGVGVWSTARDLARLGGRTMAGTGPGASAAKPRYPAGHGDRIGYAWITTKDTNGGSFTWHNGASGGCTAFLGFDRARGRVVAVLSNTGTPVDGIGVALLGHGHGGSPPKRLLPLAMAIAFPLLAGLSLVTTARGGWRRRPRRTPDRATIVGTAGWSAFLLAVAFAGGALGYELIPFWLAGWALCGAGVFIAVTRWRDLPTNDAKRPWLRWLGTGVGVVVGLVFAVGVAG
ncbi:MAG: serine hydrolase domain-containing protein [Streptosporangiales bacterium]